MAVDSVLRDLPLETQEGFASLAEQQRTLAPRAIEALENGEISGGIEPAIRKRAVQILGSFARAEFTEPGYEEVPLSLSLGGDTLGPTALAATSMRLPIDGSPNYFGQRPRVPGNEANQVAFFAINGLGVEDIVTANTGGTSNHVAVVTHADSGRFGLTQDDIGRKLPADGAGEKLTADAVVITNPYIKKALAGVHADLPIMMGTAGDALIFVNGGWQNLAAGVDEMTARKLSGLGLTIEPIKLVVGPGARNRFEVRRSKLDEACEGRQRLGVGVSLEGLLEASTNPEKVYLNLFGWAARLARNIRGADGSKVTGMDLCTLDGGKAGYLHSSRIHRITPTVPGQAADGDRAMALLTPRDVQREWAR